MAIFSDDVDNVRIIGTILIFVFSIIGAGVPIAVARTWGAIVPIAVPSKSDIEAQTSHSLAEGGKDKGAAMLSTLATNCKDNNGRQNRQATLKFIQHMFLSLGAGVIVATAVLHMMPDGTEDVVTGYAGLWGSPEASDEGSSTDSNVRAFAARSVGNVSAPNGTAPAGGDDDDVYPYGYLFALGGIFVMFLVESEMHRALGVYDQHEVEEEQQQPCIDYDGTVVALTNTKEERRYQREMAAMKAHSAKAKLLEIAVASHSVIIGVAFGALTNAKSSDPLALALIFHQFCEGFAVGAVFERAFRALPLKPSGREPEEESSFWARNGRHIGLVTFVLVFALSVPVGIFIGIGVAEGGSDPDAPGSLFARGALECFAGGVLLYVGCVEFLGGLFGSHQHSHVSTDNDCASAVDTESTSTTGREDEDMGLKNEGSLSKRKSNHLNKTSITDRHLLQTDTLFGRICTYLLVFIGGTAMAIIAKWA